MVDAPKESQRIPNNSIEAQSIPQDPIETLKFQKNFIESQGIQDNSKESLIIFRNLGSRSKESHTSNSIQNFFSNWVLSKSLCSILLSNAMTLEWIRANET